MARRAERSPFAGDPAFGKPDIGLIDQLRDDQSIAHRDVVARRLGHLDVHPQRVVAPLAIEPVHDRLQERRLARLPWGVQDEVLFRVDELLDLRPVDPRERIDAVVLRGLVGACGVEVSGHRVAPEGPSVGSEEPFL